MNLKSTMKTAAMSVLVTLSMANVHAQSLTPEEYVESLTNHLLEYGEISPRDVQNVTNLASSTTPGIGQESFIRLGNALYQTGHNDLGNQVMASSTISTDRYMGATLRVNMSGQGGIANTEIQANQSPRQQVDSLYNEIFEGHGVDRSAAAWYANAVGRGEMTIQQVEHDLQQVYQARFGNSTDHR